MMIALRVVECRGALPATVVIPSTSVCRAATVMAMASSWPGSQSRMIGRGWGDIPAELATVTLCPMRSVAGMTMPWAAAVMMLLASCGGDGEGSGAVTTTTAARAAVSETTLPVEPTTTSSETSTTFELSSTLPPEPKGVPGLDDEDPFCAAWAFYSGTVQAIGVAVAFGTVPSQEVARLEVVAAAALVAAVNGIGSNWSNELVGERSLVLTDLLGPFVRRAEKALSAAREAGVSDDQLEQLADLWLDALRNRDNESPAIVLPALSSDLAPLVEAAAAAFDAAVTPFAEDPSLVIVGLDTPLTDAYLAEHCPDLASIGVGDAV